MLFVGSGLGCLDLVEEGVDVPRGHDREKRAHLLIGREVREELRVLGGGAAQAKARTFERRAHARGVAGTTSRRLVNRTTPDPIAIPLRMSSKPAIAFRWIGSSSRKAP